MQLLQSIRGRQSAVVTHVVSCGAAAGWQHSTGHQLSNTHLSAHAHLPECILGGPCPCFLVPGIGRCALDLLLYDLLTAVADAVIAHTGCRFMQTLALLLEESFRACMGFVYGCRYSRALTAVPVFASQAIRILVQGLASAELSHAFCVSRRVYAYTHAYTHAYTLVSTWQVGVIMRSSLHSYELSFSPYVSRLSCFPFRCILERIVKALSARGLRRTQAVGLEDFSAS